MPRNPALLAHLRELLSTLERESDPSEEPDIVQLRPSADPAFGGLLMRVKKRTPYELRGYLLLPRRGGSLETWTRVKPNEVTPVGKLEWPEAEYGFSQMDHAWPAVREQIEASIQEWAGWRKTRWRKQQKEASDDDNRRIHCRGDR